MNGVYTFNFYPQSPVCVCVCAISACAHKIYTVSYNNSTTKWRQFRLIIHSVYERQVICIGFSFVWARARANVCVYLLMFSKTQSSTHSHTSAAHLDSNDLSSAILATQKPKSFANLHMSFDKLAIAYPTCDKTKTRKYSNYV